MKVVLYKSGFESTKWIEQSTNIDYVIYSRKKFENTIHIPNVVNTETHAYLQYIIDNYDSGLTEWTIFLRAEEKDPYHASSKLLSCNLNTHKMKPKGRFFPVGHSTKDMMSILTTTKKVAMQPSELTPREYQQVIKDVFGEKEYNSIIKNYFEDVGVINLQTFPQGSQFLVHKEKIRKRPLSFYKHCLEILCNKEHILSKAAWNDSSKPIGHFFFEAHWHFIFSEHFLYEEENKKKPYDYFSEMPFLKF